MRYTVGSCKLVINQLSELLWLQIYYWNREHNLPHQFCIRYSCTRWSSANYDTWVILYSFVVKYVLLSLEACFQIKIDSLEQWPFGHASLKSQQHYSSHFHVSNVFQSYWSWHGNETKSATLTFLLRFERDLSCLFKNTFIYSYRVSQRMPHV